MDVNTLISSIPADGSSAGSGKYESQLSADTRQVLGNFVELLLSEGKTTATANSYKSYVAKALVLGTGWDELTSDQKSAVRAFGRLMG